MGRRRTFSSALIIFTCVRNNLTILLVCFAFKQCMALICTFAMKQRRDSVILIIKASRYLFHLEVWREGSGFNGKQIKSNFFLVLKVLSFLSFLSILTKLYSPCWYIYSIEYPYIKQFLMDGPTNIMSACKQHYNSKIHPQNFKMM